MLMHLIKQLFPSLSFDSSYFCTICPMAKQTRLPFPHNTSHSSRALELLHVDIWGPYKFPTILAHTGFITIVDDHTRFTWTFLIKHKSEFPSLIKQFVLLVENQFDCKVKTLRSDNANEIIKGEALIFYKQHEIFLQTSCRDTPQKNGVVERKHRHLLELARALSFQSKLPQSFWGDCLQCATFLINRTPTPTLQGRTPYELLHTKVPDYSILRTYGCLVYVSTLKQGRHKFAPRATPHVFIGYSPQQKGYKVLNLATKSVSVSRDVVFFEKHFPYHYIAHSPSLTPP